MNVIVEANGLDTIHAMKNIAQEDIQICVQRLRWALACSNFGFETWILLLNLFLSYYDRNSDSHSRRFPVTYRHYNLLWVKFPVNAVALKLQNVFWIAIKKSFQWLHAKILKFLYLKSQNWNENFFSYLIVQNIVTITSFVQKTWNSQIQIEYNFWTSKPRSKSLKLVFIQYMECEIF